MHPAESYPVRRAAGLGRAFRAAATVACALLLTTCSDNPVGPGRPGFGTLRVQPGFDAYARLAPLVVDRVRVIVVRPPADTVQVINRNFSLSSNQIQITQLIPLQASSEDFDVGIELYAGSVLMFSGTSTVRVSQASSTTPQSIPVSYQGPGAQAAALSIAPRDTTLSFGAVFPFRASAIDQQQQPVPQFYVSWSLPNPAAGVSIDASGSLTVPARRDTVMVLAVTPSGLRDSTLVYFAAPPSQLVKVGGDNQSAFPGARLPLPLEVQVNGSDGLPVAGVSVNFTAPAGGSVDSATATSDAQGIARTGATLAPIVGQQSFGASATGAGTATFTATAVGIQPAPVLIAAGGNHSCEIRGTTTLCWGANTAGMLGDGSTTDRLIATPVVTPQVFVTLALGDSHSCALTAAGAAFCWGDNSLNQLGDGSSSPRLAPTAVTGGQVFVRLSAKGNSTCGLTAAGQAFCWGENTDGQLGDGTQSNRSAPTPVVGGLSFTELAVGGAHACGLSSTGAAFCWGANGNGQLGDGNSGGQQLQPVAVTGGMSFSAIALGANSSCAIATTGGAGFCWGFNFGVNLTTPTPVAGGFSYTALVMGDNHVCGLTATGWLCGGDNGAGQLGDGSKTDRQTPVAPSGGFSFTALAGGALHSCGLTATGTRCWGANTSGQLGDGTTAERLTPAARVGPAASVALNAGNNQSALPGTQLPVPPSVLVRDGLGQPLEGVEVGFVVTAGGGTVLPATALTNAAGIAETDWTLGGTAGVNGLVATVQSSAVTGNPVNFSATGTGPGGAKTWAGTVSGDWTTAGNWTPAGAPTSTDDVVIPSGTPNDPVISTSPGAARDLTLQAGATLTLGPSTLTLTGSLDAQGTITGSTTGLTLNGAGTVRGNLAGTFFQILVNGSYSLAGRLIVPGIAINGQLDLAGFTAVVGSSAGDDFQTANNGVLVMNGATDSLIMTGTGSSMVFDGGSTSGSLTSGVILVANPAFSTFEQRSTFSAQSFAPSGTHKVVFAGAGQLSLSMATPGAGSGFNDLEVSGASGGVIVAGAIQVNRELISQPAAAPPLLNGNPAKRILTVGGLRISGLTLSNIQIVTNGTLPLTQFDNVTIQGLTTGDALAINDPGRAAPYTFNNVSFTSVPAGNYLVANDLTPTDGVPLVINMVNPAPATPSGKVDTTGGAVINWPAATPVRTWTGAVSSDWHTAGNWNPAQVPATGDSVSIGAAANQPVLTAPAAVGAVTIGTGGSLTLNGLTLIVGRGFSTGGSGVLIMQDPADVLVIGGDAVFDGGNELNLMSAGIISIGGNLTQLATNSPDSYHPSGTHLTAFAGAAATVTFATPGLVPGSSHLQEFSWSGTGVLTLGSDVMAHGTATFAGGVVAGNGHRLTVGELLGTTLTFDNAELGIEQALPIVMTLPQLTFVNMASTATQFTIRHPGATLSLAGNSFSPLVAGNTGFYVAATDLDGIAPALDITVGNDPGNGAAFTSTAGGATVTWVGTGGANVWTGGVDSDWNTAGNWSLGQVPGPTDDVQIPAASTQPTLSAAATIHSLTVTLGGTLNLNGGPLTLTGNLDAPGSITGIGTIEMTGTGVTARANLDGVGLGVAAGAVVSLSGPVTMIGEDVRVEGELILNGQAVSTDGGAITSGNGVLTMTSGGDVLSATQVNFGGGDQTGRLTAGVILTQGLAQLAGGSPASFFAGGNHTVVLGGSGPSNVSFANPGSSRFQNLDLTSVTTSVTLQSSITVAGVLSASPSGAPPSVLAGTAGVVLTTGGTAITGLIMDGVPLVVSGGNSSLLLQNVDFQNQNPAGIQLTVNHDGQGSPFVFDGLDFLTAPTTGLYLQATDIDGPSPVALTIDVINSSPANGSPFFQAGGGAVVNWPPAIPAPTWTGAVNSDWFDPGNWSTGVAPGTGDSVVIALTATSPVLTAPVAIQAIEVQGGSLTINGQAFTVAGRFRTSGTGVLVMNDPADQVTVGGTAFFGGGDETGLLTAGELQLAGGLTQLGGPTSFVAGGNHVVRLINGSQSLSFASSTGATFNDLIVDMDGTANVADQIRVARDLRFGSSGAVMAGGSVLVDRHVDMGSSTLLGASFVAVGGGITAAAGAIFSPGTVQFSNPGGGTIPASSGEILYGSMVVGPFGGGGGLPYTLAGVVTMSGSLDIRSDLVVNAQALNVGTDLSTNDAGVLTMTDPADLVLVGRQTIFGGGDETGKLTAGVLRSAGNFLQLTGVAGGNSFVASGSHTVELATLSALGNQIVVSDPGVARFQNLRILTPASFTTDAVIQGDLEVDFNAMDNLLAPHLTVGGKLTKQSIGVLDIDRLTLSGDLNALGGNMVADTVEFVGTSPQAVNDNIGAGLGKVLVQNDVTWTGGTMNASGDLDIAGDQSILRLPGGDLSVGGNLSVTSAGRLVLSAPTLQGVTVGGNALFDGGDETGLLDQGRFTFKGNFTQKASISTSSFAAGPQLETIFDGNATISFDDPSKSQFGSVFITLGRTLQLASDVVVLDQTRGYSGGSLVGFNGTILGGGTTSWTTASIESNLATFDGVSLVINDPAASVNGFSNLTFKNLSTSATQLAIRYPGPTYTVSNVNFMPLLAPDAGFYLDLADSDGATPARLVVSVSHDPGNGQAKTRTDAIASAGWLP